MVKDPKKVRIEEPELGVLRQAKNEMDLAIAIAEEKQALNNRLMVQVFQKVGKAHEAHFVCLAKGCGEVYRRDKPHVCKEATKGT